MPNNVPGQIISELGQIAKDVGKQAVQIPKDIAGKALESLGATSGKTSAGDNTAWSQIGREKDQKVKQSIARKALEELAGGKITRPREPSIWERLQQEQEQKKHMQQQSAPGAMTPLPTSSSKRPVGDLYGAKAKKTATENRNVRQD